MAEDSQIFISFLSNKEMEQLSWNYAEDGDPL
jgi:hypothetical protein